MCGIIKQASEGASLLVVLNVRPPVREGKGGWRHLIGEGE